MRQKLIFKIGSEESGKNKYSFQTDNFNSADIKK